MEWNSLSASAQTALPQLGAFMDGFFPIEAQALLGLSENTLDSLLADLSARGWLESYVADDRLRYRVKPGATREFCWEKLLGESQVDGASSHGDARRAHCYCLGSLLAREGSKLLGDSATGGQGQGQALHRLKLLERDNLLPAFESALAMDDPELLRPFAAHLGRLLDMTSEFAAQKRCAEQLATAAERLNDASLQAQAANASAAAAYRVAQYEDCLRLAQAAQASARVAGEQNLGIDALRLESLAYYTLGELEPARRIGEEALALSRSCAARSTEASILNHLGNIYRQLGDFAQSRRSLEGCLAIRRSLGDRFSEAIALNNLSNLEQREGHLEAAAALLKQAIALRRELCDLQGQAGSLCNLAILQFTLGDVETARATHAQGLAIVRGLDDKLTLAGQLNNMGAIERHAGNLSGARELHLEALQVSREISYGVVEATTLVNLCGIDCLLGDFSSGKQHCSEALEVLEKLGSSPIQPKAVALCGVVLAMLGSAAEGAVLLHGGRRECDSSGMALDPDELELAEQAGQRLAQDLSPDVLGRLRGEADDLTLEELARRGRAACLQEQELRQIQRPA